MLTRTRYALAEVVTALQAGDGGFQQAQAAKSPSQCSVSSVHVHSWSRDRLLDYI